MKPSVAYDGDVFAILTPNCVDRHVGYSYLFIGNRVIGYFYILDYFYKIVFIDIINCKARVEYLRRNVREWNICDV